jgi:hypothetical protein
MQMLPKYLYYHHAAQAGHLRNEAGYLRHQAGHLPQIMIHGPVHPNR